jgi:hypothetical protein
MASYAPLTRKSIAPAYKGKSLPEPLRRRARKAFGQDFGQVRLHTDEAAARSARSLDARAYTVGRDIVFGAGQYAPQSVRGQRLISHELAHVAQQRAGAGAAGGPLPIGERGSAAERQADHLSGALASGEPAGPITSVSPQIQRQPLDVELTTPTEEQRRSNQRLGLQLPAVAANVDPRQSADYIDNRIEAVGYGVYLFGFLVFYKGSKTPLFVPEQMVDPGEQRSLPVDTAVYPSYEAALARIPVGPTAPGQPRPHAYHRTGGVILPTIFTAATAPKTVETMMGARRRLGETVQRELAVLAYSLVGGRLISKVYSRLLRIGTSAEAPRPPAGGPGGGKQQPPARMTEPPAPAVKPTEAPQPRPPSAVAAVADEAVVPMLGPAPTGPAVEYGEALALRLQAQGKTGPAVVKPVIADLNAQPTMTAQDRALAAYAACARQTELTGGTWGAGPLARMPNGSYVVTSRAPLKKAPVIIVKPDGRVVFGRADLKFVNNNTAMEVSNVTE